MLSVEHQVPLRASPSPMPMARIMAIAATLIDTTVAALKGEKRAPDLVIARKAVVVVARDHLHLSWSHIGRAMDRDHTTPLSNYRSAQRDRDVRELATQILNRLSHQESYMQTSAPVPVAVPAPITPPSKPSLHHERIAARSLMVALAEVAADDEDIRQTAIEGETDLMEAIDASIQGVVKCETFIEAIEAQEALLAARKARYAQRIARIKSEVCEALLEVGLTKVERPLATMSTSKGRDSVNIYDAARLPEEYLKPQPGKPDKIAIGKALKEGAMIPGAMIEVGGNVLTIRFK